MNKKKGRQNFARTCKCRVEFSRVKAQKLGSAEARKYYSP